MTKEELLKAFSELNTVGERENKVRDGFSIEHHDDGLMTIKGRAHASGSVINKLDYYFDNLPEEKFKEISDRVDEEIKNGSLEIKLIKLNKGK